MIRRGFVNELEMDVANIGNSWHVCDVARWRDRGQILKRVWIHDFVSTVPVE
jgi:hypothetical protein